MSTNSKSDKFDNLQRELQPMSEFINKALSDNGVMDDYLARPAYQQNDYLSWINRAKQEATKTKRLASTTDVFCALTNDEEANIDIATRLQEAVRDPDPRSVTVFNASWRSASPSAGRIS